jgi:cytochrome c oxidase accessory protein FixG
MSDLDSAKLTSVNENGDRIGIIPAEVKGFFRKHRDWSQAVLLIIFLALPWTTINGHPTIFLNVPEREFALFGLLFKAHDAPLLVFVLGSLALTLAFVTSVWGRIWCGWACPQTVFIDGVYRRIEKLVEGTYIERRKLRDAPMSFQKFRIYSLKWFLFVVVSGLIAHSFMAYFIGATNLLEMMQHSPSENLTYFVLVFSFTALILFDFAWFREQFCTIACPYGRIQSVLLDQKSMAIVYDVARGEPRKSRALANQPAGDCVSCNRCVQVCPTGIDIRNGLQMECIACTACADACDEIMVKVKKPTGLIGYKTLDGSKIKLLKPRSILYMVGIGLMILALIISVARRTPADWTILRGQGLPYSFVKGESGEDLILNQFRLHIQNQSGEDASYSLSIPAPHSDSVSLTVAQSTLVLKPGESREWYFFVRFPKNKLPASGQLPIQLQLKDSLSKDGYEEIKPLILLGPQ